MCCGTRGCVVAVHRGVHMDGTRWTLQLAQLAAVSMVDSGVKKRVCWGE
jgi:hypothetical protein